MMVARQVNVFCDLLGPGDAIGYWLGLGRIEVRLAMGFKIVASCKGVTKQA